MISLGSPGSLLSSVYPKTSVLCLDYSSLFTAPDWSPVHSMNLAARIASLGVFRIVFMFPSPSSLPPGFVGYCSRGFPKDNKKQLNHHWYSNSYYTKSLIHHHSPLGLLQSPPQLAESALGNRSPRRGQPSVRL